MPGKPCENVSTYILTNLRIKVFYSCLLNNDLGKDLTNHKVYYKTHDGPQQVTKCPELPVKNFFYKNT